MDVAVVIPNRNGARWLPGVLDSLTAQTVRPCDVVVVDDGSTDASRALVAERFPAVRVVALPGGGGFARTANAGLAAVSAEAVALVNTDVVLAPDWIERAAAALSAAPGAAAVATKLVDLDDPAVLYDAGDLLRRDGACEQRGRFERDTGRYDTPGEVFSACAAAALYRRAALLAVGGFDERLGTYLDDVDLGLRLQLAGWTCRWEPHAVARHAGGGSEAVLPHGAAAWVERNTLLLVARAFRARWLPLVAYRQAAWAWHAARAGRLRAHLTGAVMAVPLLPAFVRERRALREGAVIAIDQAIPARPIRGPRAGGHPSRHYTGRPVPVRRLAAACACGLALASPGTALAQGGAGDDQYTDPFGSQQATPTATARPAPTATAAPDAPAATPTPAPTAAPAATAQPAARAGAAAPATASSSRQLPYTGEPIWLVVAAGALLLGGGLALRARLRDQR